MTYQGQAFPEQSRSAAETLRKILRSRPAPRSADEMDAEIAATGRTTFQDVPVVVETPRGREIVPQEGMVRTVDAHRGYVPGTMDADWGPIRATIGPARYASASAREAKQYSPPTFGPPPVLSQIFHNNPCTDRNGVARSAAPFAACNSGDIFVYSKLT